MGEYSQSTEKSVQEDFYQTMLLKYKKEAIEKEKLIKEEDERETERILDLEYRRTLKNKKGFFAAKERVNNAYNSWINKSSLPKSNLAFRFQDKNSYLPDGAGAGAGARVGARAKKATQKQLGNFSKMRSRLGKYRKIRKATKPLLQSGRGKKFAQAISKRIPLDQLDDLSDTIGPYGDIAALGSEMLDYKDFVKKDEEGQTQVNLKKAKKVAMKGHKAVKAVRVIKQAKEAKKAVQVAKAAKVGVQAAKVAKTVKTAKTVLTILKVITIGAAVETIFISLIVTVIIWWVQIIGAHLMKSKYIPRMSKLDWIGFGLLVGPSYIFQALPIIILIAAVWIHAYIGSWALENFLIFLGWFKSLPAGAMIEIITSVI